MALGKYVRAVLLVYSYHSERGVGGGRVSVLYFRLGEVFSSLHDLLNVVDPVRKKLVLLLPLLVRFVQGLPRLELSWPL